jgi:CBS domain-containing protein
MKSIVQILRSKPEQTVQAIAPSASVFDAVKMMAEKNIGALLVMEDVKVVGIITERDYARKIVLMGRSSKETPVRDIMTSPVMYARPDQTNEECMALIARHGSRQAGRPDLHRRLGERHHFRAETDHSATRALHCGRPRLNALTSGASSSSAPFAGLSWGNVCRYPPIRSCKEKVPELRYTI